MRELTSLELKPVLRKTRDQPYTTDERNYIVDVDVFNKDDLHGLNQILIAIPGVVETGLFLTSTDIVIMGINTTTQVIQK